MNEIVHKAAEGQPGTAISALYSFEQMLTLAEAVARSGFIKGARTPDAALALMLVCQAQGRSIGEAITRFHVIEGVPSVKADVMLADFQARGGRLKWVTTDNAVAKAEFWHPQYHPDHLTIQVTMEELVENRVAMSYNEKIRAWEVKANYRRSPAAMLRARCQTQGIRAVDPGAIHGFYSSEEVADFNNDSIDVEARISPPEGSAPESPRRPAGGPAVDSSGTIQDLPVPGFAGPGFDDRPYHRLISEAGEAVHRDLEDLAIATLGDHQRVYCPDSRVDHEFHRRLLWAAANQQYSEGPPPTKMSEAIKEMAGVYRSHREWVRSELNALCDALRKGVEEMVAAAAAKAPEPAQPAAPVEKASEPASPPWKNPEPPSSVPEETPPGRREKEVYLLDGKEVSSAELIAAAKAYGYEPGDGLFRTSDAAYVLRENSHKVATREARR